MAVLKSVEIENIRSYQSRQIFEFSIPGNGRYSGLNVIVGENNSGKSTFISLLGAFCWDREQFVVPFEQRRRDRRPEFRFEFDYIEDGQRKTECCGITYVGSEATFSKNGNVSHLIPHLRTVPSRRAFSARFTSQGVNPVDYEYNDFSSRKSNPGHFDSSLAAGINKIVLDGRKSEFIAFLRRVDSSIEDISVDNYANSDVLLFRGSTGLSHAMSEVGDGVGSLIRIFFAIFYSSDESVIIVDEPELSLSPRLQRNLFDLLLDISQTRQVIVVTHSPHFVDWASIRGGAKMLRVQISGGGSKVFTPSEASISNIANTIDNDFKNRKLYDVLAKEMFFSPAAVFVEGQEDVHYLENYAVVSGRLRLPMMGYGCGGAGNIIKWMQFANDIGIRSVGLFDGNKKDEFERASRILAEIRAAGMRVELLPASDIRDKYVLNERGRETAVLDEPGIFAKGGELNPEFRELFEGLYLRIEKFVL